MISRKWHFIRLYSEAVAAQRFFTVQKLGEGQNGEKFLYLGLVVCRKNCIFADG